MKKQMVFVMGLAMFALNGCALTMKDVPVIGPTIIEDTGPGAGLSLGMTREQVIAVMDKPVTVGFEFDAATGVTKAIQINSLYSSEVLTLGASTYLVDYYIVDTQKAQTRIADADLYPVVFLQDILAAKGRAEFQALKETHQNR